MISADLFSWLQYGFIQRAYLAGSLVAILCALLGLILVLRQLSLIGDGLAHVSFGAIALGLFLGWPPFYVAVPLVALASLLVGWLAKNARLYGDAAIGLVSAVGIAGGVILASLSHGFNVDLLSYLFGNILAISAAELWLAVILSLVVLGLILFFYHDLLATTFDPDFAKVSGLATDKLESLVNVLTAVTVVLAIKMVGVMLVSALLILPAVTALQTARSFRDAMWLAAGLSVLAVLLGVTFSFLADWPTGATIIVVDFLFFLLSLLFKR